MMEKKQGSAKISYKEQRRLQRQKEAKLQKVRKTMVITGVFAILIAVILFVMLQPKSETASKGIAFPYETLAIVGNPDAPIKIVEFGDFYCPACAFFATEMFPQLKQDFIDPGLVSFYFANFQVYTDPTKAGDSTLAAVAGEAIRQQNNDAFWAYYDAIYKNQGDHSITWATKDFLLNFVKQHQVPIDYDRFTGDLDLPMSTKSNPFLQKVTDDKRFGISTQKINATPSIFINGKMSDHPFDYPELKAEINAAIEQAKR